MAPLGLLMWLAFITNTFTMAAPCMNEGGVPRPCPDGTNNNSKQGQLILRSQVCLVCIDLDIKNSCKIIDLKFGRILPRPAPPLVQQQYE